MGPARFHCATLLCVQDQRILDDTTKIFPVRSGIRTHDPEINLVPYPLGHMVLLVWQELYGWVDVRTFHAGLQPDENIWNLGNIVVSFYDMLEPVLDIVERNMCWHRWFSGRMLACHAGGPGSIPGRCKFFLLFFASKQMQHEYHCDLFLLSPMQRKMTYFQFSV